MYVASAVMNIICWKCTVLSVYSSIIYESPWKEIFRGELDIVCSKYITTRYSSWEIPFSYKSLPVCFPGKLRKHREKESFRDFPALSFSFAYETYTYFVCSKSTIYSVSAYSQLQHMLLLPPHFPFSQFLPDTAYMFTSRRVQASASWNTY